MPKIIHLEKGEDLMAYGVETDSKYEFFTIDKSDKIIPTNSYEKSDFESYKHFAGVLGKFNPFTFILEKPLELAAITFNLLSREES